VIRLRSGALLQLLLLGALLLQLLLLLLNLQLPLLLDLLLTRLDLLLDLLLTRLDLLLLLLLPLLLELPLLFHLPLLNRRLVLDRDLFLLRRNALAGRRRGLSLWVHELRGRLTVRLLSLTLLRRDRRLPRRNRHRVAAGRWDRARRLRLLCGRPLLRWRP